MVTLMFEAVKSACVRCPSLPWRAAAALCPEEAELLPGTLSEAYSLSPLLRR